MKPSLSALAAATALVLLTAAFATASGNADRARELIDSQGCKGCHIIGGSGGNLGPALDQVGKRLNKEQILKQLTDPNALNPETMMPSFGHLPQEDLEALAEYLEGLK